MPTREEFIEAYKSIIDPELYIDIWTLGLIYGFEEKENEVNVRMTFTSMGCPAGPYLVEQVREKTMALEGVEKTNVEIVFDPPWTPSEELKALMGIA